MLPTISWRGALRKFPTCHPLLKIGAWIGAVALVAAVLQAALWVIGSDISLLSHGSRGVLLGITIACLLVVMRIDRRSTADYGLVVGPQWRRDALSGVAIGGVFYAAYCVAAWLIGAVELNEQGVPGRRVLAALPAGMSAIPIAVCQQLIFSGYVLSTLRDRYRPLLAVGMMAGLFAAFSLLNDPGSLRTVDSQRLFVGMFLIAALLGLLRLWCGSLPFPIGILAGCILIRRVFRKTALFVPAESSDYLSWLAPANDPRQGLAMWCLLAAGIVCAWLLLLRHGEMRTSAHASIDASFKAVFPFSNLHALAPLDVWIRQLWDARFRVGWKYVPRLAFILAASALNTVVSLPERLLAPLVLRRRRIPSPVFVLGVHRSGTTHLHNLLALDPQFCFPRNYQTINPVGCLTLGWLTAGVLAPFLTLKRPMDGVVMDAFTPQEEEHALACLSHRSPYWAMTFPLRVAGHDRYIFPDRLPALERSRWMACYRLFVAKLTFWRQRRPLLKSPYNTARVAILRELFPDAKFIHIVRNPHHVFRSNMRLASEGHVVFQLQDPDPGDSYQTRFLDNYRELEDAFQRDSRELPAGDVAEIRFEDLEQNPLEVIRAAYAELRIEYTPAFHRRLEDYLRALGDFQKNRFAPLPGHEQAAVERAMAGHLHRWGYASGSSASVSQRAA